MNEIYKLKEIKFDEVFMFMNIDNHKYQFKLSDISAIISKASMSELNDFQISPAGYGIHWDKLDEDLSIPGLLKFNEENKPKHQTYKVKKQKNVLVKETPKKKR